MAKIDVSQWKEFKIGDLFDVGTGASVSKAILDMHSEGNIPRISVSNENNGVIETFSKFDDKNMRYFTNFISVNFFGHAFYHPGLASLEMKVHALTLKDHRSFTTSIALFLVSLLNVCFKKENFDYGHQLSSSKLKTGNFRIKLPVTPDGKPDWDYMDNYIVKLAARAHRDVSSLNQVKPKRHQINISGWKEFKVGDLFDSVLTDGDNKQGELPDGNIPLISATADNNGVVGYYESDTTVFPANSITVDMFGHAFVQPKAFQTVAHGRVNVLLTGDLSFNAGCLVASVIERAASLHEFGFKTMLNQHKLKNLKINLPTTPDGNPDWDYMDNYIAELAARAHQDVTALRLVAGM